MCGIVGLVSSHALDSRQQIEDMLHAQRHRGPDASGLFESDACILGHNRLSIVDLHSGKQPMTTEDGRYTVVFNGEIYGYKKIRKSLAYPFKTESDTEVILALYCEYGCSMLDHLPGMFSFAIWDNYKQELFFARDRVGEKPFYFSLIDKGGFIFASEVKTLANSTLIDLTISQESIAHFLSKLYVHPNHSIYKNIHSLPAGHFGFFSSGELAISKYWEPSIEEIDISFFEAVEELESLFKESIAEQLVADVPVSVFLSGGLDSSTVASYAKAALPDIKALSFRFPPPLDEGLYASAVAQQHHINLVEIRDEQQHSVRELFEKSVDCYGEPFADSSSIPTMQICSAAARHSKVVLTGDGADELFGGYVGRYRPNVYMHKMLGHSKLRVMASRFVFGAVGRLTAKQNIFYRSQGAKHLLEKRSISQALDYNNSIFKDEELLPLGLTRQIANHPKNQQSVSSGMALDILNYMPGDILKKTDCASMLVGLELRAPFLSRKIVDFSCSLPASFKITRKADKKIMRQAFGKCWPDVVQNRPKQGFGSPVSDWLKSESLRELKHEMYEKNARIFDLLDSGFVERYKEDVGMKGWALLNLATWLERTR